MNEHIKDTAGELAVSLSQENNKNGDAFYFGDAPEYVVNLTLTSDAPAVIVSYDEEYFALGKKIKDLGREHNRKDVFFCLDEDADADNVCSLLSSVKNPACIVSIGSAFLAEICYNYAKNNSIIFIWLPTDFNFSPVLKIGENRNDFNVVFDLKYYEKLKKSTQLSGFKSVLSSRILFIEMRVNELINGFTLRKPITGLINDSLKELGKYIVSNDIKELIKANLIKSMIEIMLPFASSVSAVNLALNAYKTSCEKEENEYFAYRILLNLYSFFLNDEGDYLIKLPSIVKCEERVKELKIEAERLYFPAYSGDEQKTKILCEIIRKDEIIKEYVRALKKVEKNDEKEIYYIYAGRKNTVEVYNAKQRAEALKLAPILQKGDSLLKIMWAAGYIEYA